VTRDDARAAVLAFAINSVTPRSIAELRLKVPAIVHVIRNDFLPRFRYRPIVVIPRRSARNPHRGCRGIPHRLRGAE